jgi:cleavage stimulation factor subunit 2
MNRGIGNRSCSVFVGNIPYEVTEEMLKQVFSAVGEVVSFRLMYDKNTKLPKGYGFCEYKDPETAYAAMRNLNNVECGGRPLRVDWADHELRNTEGVLKQPGRAQTIDPTLKQQKLKNNLMNDFHERLTDENAEELSEDARLHCDIAALLSYWPSIDLLNVLGHMQRLVFESPDTARHLLSQHPQLALALSQISYLLGLVADPALPISTNDEEFINQRIQQLRNSRIAPQNPLGQKKEADKGKFSEEEKQRVREQLAQMTQDQIASLPDEVKNLMREIMTS